MIKNYGNVTLINKSAYSPTEKDIAAICQSCDEIEIAGVVTDICVFQTAIAIYTYLINNNMLDKKIIIDSSACASFNQKRAEQSLVYLKNVLNIIVI